MAVTVTTQSSSLHATGNQYGDVHVRDNAVVHMGNNIYRMEVELDQLLILARKADQADQRLQRPLGHQIQPAAPMSAVNSSRLATTAPPALSPSQLCDVGATRAYHPNGPITQSSSQMTAVSAVGIRVSHFPRAACTPWCSCVCHSEVRLQTPGFLRQVVGSFFYRIFGNTTLYQKM